MTKMTDEQHQIDNDEISLKELIQKIQEWIAYLKTQWKLIFIAAVLGGSLGYIYAYKQPITYTAVLSFALEEDRGGGGGGGGISGIASQFGIDIGASAGGAFAGSNLIELIKSRLVIEKTLLSPIELSGKKISIAEYYIQINKLRQIWEKNPDLKNIQFLPNADRSRFNLKQDSILNWIYLNLSGPELLSLTQKNKSASITNIEVTYYDENFAKIFCESLAKEISEFYIETKSKKSRLNVDILQKQTDSIRSELNSAISGVASASDNVYNLNPALNIKSTPSKKRQVDVQSNTAILTQLISQLEMSKMALRKETPLIQVIDRPILPLKKQKLSKLKSLAIGVFLASFLMIFYLLFSSMYKKLFTDIS
jgi:uncharacterized protein involved in exopolysaccharide biosynthesis